MRDASNETNTERERITSATAASQGLTRRSLAQSVMISSKSMKLKDRGSWEVSERRQVGDAEAELTGENRDAWWRNVGMDEGL